MRRACTVVLGLVMVGLFIGAPRPAYADDPAEADRLVAEGVALGEAGDYLGAIERFAAAERAFSRPVHDCNVGLAWIGLDKPATAYFFIERCRRRARAALPGWVDEQHAALTARLTSGGYAQVRISSTPPGALLTIDTLPGAEPRTPVTVWVPAVPMTVVGRLTGFVVTERTFETPPAAVTLALRRPVVAAPVSAPPSEAPAAALPSTGPPPVVPMRAPPSTPLRAPTTTALDGLTAPGADRALAWSALGVSAVAAAAGGYFLYDAHTEADAAFAASDRRDLPGMNAAKESARLSEAFAYGAFGLAAVAAAWGVWTLSAEAEPDVAIVPLGMGAGVRLRMP